MTDTFQNVQLLLTGNEIMSGDTVDSNSALIAQRLAELGLTVWRKVTVGDDRSLLEAELRAMAETADLVIVNGGLGPTIDDLTAEILAAVAGVPIEEHPEAIAHLEQWCAQRNLPLNDANRKQALLPAGCTLIPNDIGSAVGFEMTVSSCRVMCTPPERDILRLQTFGLGESSAQQLIADRIPDWPAQVELGFRAGAPQMEIKLSIDSHAHRPLQQRCLEQLQALFGDHIIGTGDTLIAERVLALLREQGKTLATAESCTGGLIASMLTRIPGSSDGFHAGFVTYANDIKHRVLGVSEATLEQQGAVSEEVVIEMANGAMARANADCAIAVSGIAGPDGGTPEKPVGTVWLAWGSRENLRTRCLCWPVERTLFQTMVAAAGLDMIRRMLLGLESEPRYFDQRRAR